MLNSCFFQTFSLPATRIFDPNTVVGNKSNWAMLLKEKMGNRAAKHKIEPGDFNRMKH